MVVVVVVTSVPVRGGYGRGGGGGIAALESHRRKDFRLGRVVVRAEILQPQKLYRDKGLEAMRKPQAPEQGVPAACAVCSRRSVG